MARPEKFTTTQIIEAIRKAQTAAGAARILECDSDTIRNYAKRHPTVDRALYNEREDLADYAEMGLKRAVLNGEAWAIALAVKTLRKGVYSERHELGGPDGGPVVHEHRGQVHGSIEHVAAVIATLAGVGAIQLPGDVDSGAAENDALHRRDADG